MYLDEDLLFLLPDVDLRLFDDQLLGPAGRLHLERDLPVRPLRLDLGLRLEADHVAVPVVLRDLGLGVRVRLLPLLGGDGLRDRGLSVRVRLPDAGVPLDLLRPLHAEGVEVAVLVLDLLDHERADLDAHVLEVLARHREDAGGERVPVGVNLLDRQGRADATDVALQGLQGDLVDLDVGLVEELACGGP